MSVIALRRDDVTRPIFQWAKGQEPLRGWLDGLGACQSYVTA